MRGGFVCLQARNVEVPSHQRHDFQADHQTLDGKERRLSRGLRTVDYEVVEFGRQGLPVEAELAQFRKAVRGFLSFRKD